MTTPKRREYRECIDCKLKRVVVIRDFGRNLDGVHTPELYWPSRCTACHHLQRAIQLENDAKRHRAKAHVIFEARKAKAKAKAEMEDWTPIP